MNALAEGQTARLYFEIPNSLQGIVHVPRCTACSRSSSSLVASPYFLYQAIRYKKYIGSLGQRLGYLPISFNVDGDESIWIHAVSVGEALTARALAADLKARYPRLRLFLSTTTIAGQQVAREASSTSTASSISRSTGPSSSGARSGSCSRASSS